MSEIKGHYKHGEFDLPLIVKVKYAKKVVDLNTRLEHEEFDGRPYTYFTAEPLAVGDVIQVPVTRRGGDSPEEHLVTAQVVGINVPEAEVAAFKDKVKTIPAKAKKESQEPAHIPEDTNVLPSDEIFETGDTCKSRQDYPMCSPPDVEFGDGKGNDNIIKCSKHEVGPAEPCTVPLNVKIDPKAEKPALPAELEAIKPSPNAELIHALQKEEPEPDIFELPEEAKLPAPLENLWNVAQHIPPGLLEVYKEADALLKVAEKRIIANVDDLQPATDDLSIISKSEKKINEIKKELITPYRQKVDIINGVFNELLQPFEAAEKITKNKMLEYDNIQREKTALAQREAAAQGGEITQELGHDVPDKTTTSMGTAGKRDDWKYKVEDFALLPDEYKVEDHAQLTAIARSHHDKKQIPGVRFYNEPYIATRPRGR